MNVDFHFIGHAYIERLPDWRKIPAFALDIKKVLSLYTSKTSTDRICRIWCDSIRKESNYPFLKNTDEDSSSLK